MPRRIGKNQRRADLARFERALLLVNRTDPRTLFVVQHRQVDCARDVIFGKLRRAAHVDHGVKPMRKDVGEAFRCKTHARVLARGMVGEKPAKGPVSP